MTTHNDGAPSNDSARDRLLRVAYDLFCRFGIRPVGVDTVVAEANVAKKTLYRHFPSKNDLIVTVLRRREELWTRAWLQREVTERGHTPAERLLAIFDVFGEWFARDDFEGCTFINALVEFEDEAHPVHQASVRHLANIRDFLGELAADAGADDPDSFARQWHVLMKGSIIAAMEGDQDSGRRAREMGALLLEHRVIASQMPGEGGVA